MSISHVPAGHSTASPYLVVAGAPAVIDLMRVAFGGHELMRALRADGTIRHAEVRIDDAVIMIAEASAAYPARPAMVHLYVRDTDEAYQRALAAGATSVAAPGDQY